MIVPIAYDFVESDWKLFRERLPGWQERFMGSLVREYVDLLNGEMKNSDKFWNLEHKINKDRKKVGVIAEMSRSRMVKNLANLLLEGAITVEELDGFSDDLVKVLKSVLDYDDDAERAV